MTLENKYTAISLAMTDTETAQYKASTYGQHGSGKRFIHDLIMGTVQPIAASRSDGKRKVFTISCTIGEREILDKMATVAGYRFRGQWIFDQLFTEGSKADTSLNVTPEANSRGDICFTITDDAVARYKDSSYGRYGGSAKLIADLLAGTVQPIPVSHGSGQKKTNFSIKCSHDDREAMTKMAKAAGYKTRSKWIVNQLFTEATEQTEVVQNAEVPGKTEVPEKTEVIESTPSAALNLAPDTRATLSAAAVNAGVNVDTYIVRRLDELARLLREAGL
ncbi:hypothetical protein [Citricoccus nitrophenolicus]|uniref:hypothetical protein n=1 Tax=Citricoccus nitrophenolicus TaxID=863575 RepID=UPI0031EBFFA9